MRNDLRARHHHQEVDDCEQCRPPMLSRRREVPDHHSGYRYDGRLALGAVVEHDAEYHYQRQKSHTNIPVTPIAQVKTCYRENDRDPDHLHWPGWPVEPG